MELKEELTLTSPPLGGPNTLGMPDIAPLRWPCITTCTTTSACEGSAQRRNTRLRVTDSTHVTQAADKSWCLLIKRLIHKHDRSANVGNGLE